MILNNITQGTPSWLKPLALGVAFCFFFAADLKAQEESESQTQTEQSTEPQEESQTEPRTQPEQQAEPQNDNQPLTESEAEEQAESEIATESNEAQTEPETRSGMDSEGFPPMEPEMRQQQALSSEDLSDEQLEAFVKSANKVMEIHEEAEEKMVQTIEQHDLDVETFNQILQARQAEQVPEAAPEKVEAFQKAFPEILNEQQKINAKIEASLQEEGLDVETYEDIMIAYQQDTELQQRVNELIQKNGTK